MIELDKPITIREVYALYGLTGGCIWNAMNKGLIRTAGKDGRQWRLVHRDIIKCFEQGYIHGPHVRAKHDATRIAHVEQGKANIATAKAMLAAETSSPVPSYTDEPEDTGQNILDQLERELIERGIPVAAAPVVQVQPPQAPRREAVSSHIVDVELATLAGMVLMLTDDHVRPAMERQIIRLREALDELG